MSYKTKNSNICLRRDVRLPMVLWGNFASDVTNAIQLRGEGRVILVLRFGKIKVWKGILNVHVGLVNIIILIAWLFLFVIV